MSLADVDLYTFGGQRVYPATFHEEAILILHHTIYHFSLTWHHQRTSQQPNKTSSFLHSPHRPTIVLMMPVKQDRLLPFVLTGPLLLLLR